MPRPCLLAVYGPTGSGKSALAEKLAGPFCARLISVDAFQVYQGFDIGTGKPKQPHNWLGVDLIQPEESFGVVEFIRFVLPLLEESFQREENVILAGGTGQYMRALLEEFSDLGPMPDPVLRADLMRREEEEGLESLVGQLFRLNPYHQVDVKNPIRVRRSLERLLQPTEPFRFAIPPFRKLKIGLDVEPNLLAIWQEKRISDMFRDGWAVEIEGLMAKGIPEEAPAWRAIGYDVVKRALIQQSSLTEAMAQAAVLHRQYAKRQRTWLRKEPHLQWVNVSGETQNFDDLAHEVMSHIRAGKKENG